MALDALWAVLMPAISGVSEVSRVQAPVHAGLRETPVVLAKASRESSDHNAEPEVFAIGGLDSPDTPQENLRYQAQPAWALSCTLDTPDTSEKNNTDLRTTETTHALAQAGAKRLFRSSGPWLSESEQSAARTYHAHHFNCQSCIAAGRGSRYGRRCSIGLALWSTYQRRVTESSG